jgi:hypothetical protein
VINLNVCNRGNETTLISVAISNSATAPTNAEWLEFESSLIAKGTLERTGMLVNPGQYLIVKSSKRAVNAMAWGVTSGETVVVPTITQNQGGAPTWITPTTTIETGSWGTINFQAEAARTYSVLSGSLPAGAILEPDTGRLRSFTLPGSATTSSFTLRATSPTGFTADRAFSVIINTSSRPAPQIELGVGGGSAPPAPVVVVTTTGGTITSNGVYQTHTFSSVGSDTFTISSTTV